jgi:hypothetical protein
MWLRATRLFGLGTLVGLVEDALLRVTAACWPIGWVEHVVMRMCHLNPCLRGSGLEVCQELLSLGGKRMKSCQSWWQQCGLQYASH